MCVDGGMRRECGDPGANGGCAINAGDVGDAAFVQSSSSANR
jgi:hypothetical protein